MEKKTKYIILGLGVVALGTGAYVYYLQKKKKKEQNNREFTQAITSSNIPSLPSPSSSSSSSTSVRSSFPLKKGSSGSLVKNLQNALIKKYGAGILPKYGADGGFGSETLRALTSKGLPTTIDSDTYTKIIISSGSSSSSKSSQVSNASSIATTIYNAIVKDSIGSAITGLKQINSVSDYTAVNTHFKKKRVGLVRMTLVTGLLSTFNSTTEKKLINQELYRIGLKYDGSKWSLSGVFGVAMDQLVTIESTKIWDEHGSGMMIPKGTIIGEYLDANDGVTEVETLDGKRLFIKTTSISYVS